MDQQGIERRFLFPTLGVGMEEALARRPPAPCTPRSAPSTAGSTTTGASPTRTGSSPRRTSPCRPGLGRRRARVGARARRPGGRDARRAGHRPGRPTRSPGDPVYDPFWARAAEAGITVAFHSGDAGYGHYVDDWEPSGEFEAFRRRRCGTMTERPGDRRHVRRARLPRRVRPLSRTCACATHRERQRVGARRCSRSSRRPTRRTRRRSPATRSSCSATTSGSRRSTRTTSAACADTIGADRVLFGSDCPTPRAWPTRTRSSTTCTASPTTRSAQIMRDNAFELIGASVGRCRSWAKAASASSRR